MTRLGTGAPCLLFLSTSGAAAGCSPLLLTAAFLVVDHVPHQDAPALAGPALSSFSSCDKFYVSGSTGRRVHFKPWHRVGTAKASGHFQ